MTWVRCEVTGRKVSVCFVRHESLIKSKPRLVLDGGRDGVDFLLFKSLLSWGPGGWGGLDYNAESRHDEECFDVWHG